MTFGLVEIVQLIALYHAGLMGVVILLHPRLRSLGLLCISFALHMGFDLGLNTGLVTLQFDITGAFGLLYGPFFYLFVRDLCFEHQKTHWLDALHALPAILVAIVRPEAPISEVLGYLSLGVYIGMSLMILREHRHLTAEIRSDTDVASLHWLELVLAFFAGLAIFDIGRDIFSASLRPIQDDIILSTLIMSVPILFSLMTTRSLNHQKQKAAFPETLNKAEFTDSTEPTDTPDFNANFIDVDQLVRDEELWRDISFSLADLAKHTGLAPRELARSINAGSGQSFASYINSIRIEAADKVMAESGNTKQALGDIHSDIGFASQATFNRVYKEQKGITPAKALNAQPSTNQ